MIEKKTFLFTIILFLCSLFFILGGIIKTKNTIGEKAKENQQLLSNAQTVTVLKEKWANKIEIEKIVAKLNSFPNIVTSESKGGKYNFTFNIDNPTTLDDISNVIFNSNLIITKFTIKKSDQFKAILSVEFSK